MVSRNITILVTVDTECDKGPSWQVRHPMQFESVKVGIPQVLMPFLRQFGIIPTFLLSPEVIRSIECCRTLEKIPDCELGTHLHGEFIEPKEISSPTRTDVPQIWYTPAVEFQKLENLAVLFQSRFSYRPSSFRAGRFGLSRHTLRFLSELGYLADSSVTPFWTHYFDGKRERNYWGAPVQPYFPNLEDPRRPGKSPILEVPVTIIHPRFVRWPRWLLRRVNSRTRWLKKLGHVLPGNAPNRPLWLRPWYSTAKEMIYVAETVIGLAPPNRPVVLNMMYHSVELIPGASPYPQTEEEVQYFLKSQEAFFRYLFTHHEVKSVGLSELYTILCPR